MAGKTERRWVTAEEFHKDPSDDVVVQKYGAGVVKVEDDDGRTVRFVISDESVDRDNDTISVDGWELSSFESNPVVLFAHDKRSLPIAKALTVERSDGKLVADTEFATADDNPMAEQVFRLIRGGFLRASSVGFRPLEWTINEDRGGIDFQKQELVEFSVVPVPANPHALVAAESKGVDLDPLREWLADTLAAWPGELKLPGTAWEKVLDNLPEKDEPPALDTDALEAMRSLSEQLSQLAESGIEVRVASKAEAEKETGKDEDDPADDTVVELIADDDRLEIDTETLNDGIKRSVAELVAEQIHQELQYRSGRVT